MAKDFPETKLNWLKVTELDHGEKWDVFLGFCLNAGWDFCPKFLKSLEDRL